MDDLRPRARDRKVKRNVTGEAFDRANSRDIPLDELLVRNPEYLLKQPVQFDGDSFRVLRADATSERSS